MRLEILTYRFELEVIKGDFNIDYNGLHGNDMGC